MRKYLEQRVFNAKDTEAAFWVRFVILLVVYQTLLRCIERIFFDGIRNGSWSYLAGIWEREGWSPLCVLQNPFGCPKNQLGHEKQLASRVEDIKMIHLDLFVDNAGNADQLGSLRCGENEDGCYTNYIHRWEWATEYKQKDMKHPRVVETGYSSPWCGVYRCVQLGWRLQSAWPSSKGVTGDSFEATYSPLIMVQNEACALKKDWYWTLNR